MTLLQAKINEARVCLESATAKKAKLLEMSPLSVMANPDRFKRDMSEVFDAVIAGMWKLTEAITETK